MAPMSTHQLSRRLGMSSGSFPTNHDGHPEPLAKIRRRLHHISNSGYLWSRQTSLSTRSGAPANSDLISPGDAPALTLHASIVPHPSASPIIGGLPTTSTYTSHTHAQTLEIALIATGAAFVALLSLGMIIIRTRKPDFFPICFRRCRRTQSSKKATAVTSSNKKGILITSVDDYDDLTWGTPTRIIHFESTFDGIVHDQDPVEPILYQHGEPLSNIEPPEATLTSRPTFTTPAIESVPHLREKTFQKRLHLEEEDIASALNVALRDLLSPHTTPSQPADTTTMETPQETEVASSLVVTNRDTAISTFDSLRDGLNGVGKHASIFGFNNRPRQGSDASASSQETVITHTNECFSFTDSRSSVTSVANSDSYFSDEDVQEGLYELKRAQTQSLEIKKGVLIAWQCTNQNPKNIRLPSKVVISEPCPKNSNECPGMSHASGGSTFRAGEFGTSQTVSSLVREISLGTLASFSSTTPAEGCCSDGEGSLQPPIPYLMVTRPSTSSILTTDTNGSSVSIELNDFPYPPSLTPPAYLQQLTDQNHSQKRVWDNHPLGSTMAQKRSTVERFIMMYETD